MNTVVQSASNADIRSLEGSEIDAVAGSWIFAAIAAELFAVGVIGGMVAFNVTHHRPWNEF